MFDAWTVIHAPGRTKKERRAQHGANMAPAWACGAAGTSPVDAAVRETIMERWVRFQSRWTENGPAFRECCVCTNKCATKWPSRRVQHHRAQCAAHWIGQPKSVCTNTMAITAPAWPVSSWV